MEAPSLKELNKVLNQGEFTIDTRRSLLSLLSSLACYGFIIGFALYFQPYFLKLSPLLSYPLLLATSFIIGTVMVGFWILAHECGHGSFLKNQKLADAIGVLLHGFCLIPYYAWARTHKLHHANHGHIIKDTAYVPPVQGSWQARILYDQPRKWLPYPFAPLLHLVSYLFLGWPLYLLFGITGSRIVGLNHFFPGKKGSFQPYSGIENKMLVNSLLYFAWIAFLVWSGLNGYIQELFWFYLLPILWVNVWLVVYTYLHHSAPDSQWMNDKSWSFEKGAFTSIDRKYWKLTNWLHHGIGRFHIYHHINSKIPHYHARSATKLLQKHFPEHYQLDNTPILKALWKNFTSTGPVAFKPANQSYYFPDKTQKAVTSGLQASE